MDKNILTSLILESKILYHFTKYSGLLKEDQYLNYKDVLRSFLLIFLIPHNIKLLNKKLTSFLNSDVAIKVIGYKELFIVEKTDETRDFLSSKSEWKLVMNIYKSLNYFSRIFKENLTLIVVMEELSNMFSFGNYGNKNIDLYEKLKIQVKLKTGYSNDYYLLLVFYCIFYQVDYCLFKKFDFYINKDRADKYFLNIENGIFDDIMEKYILNSIQISDTKSEN